MTIRATHRSERSTWPWIATNRMAASTDPSTSESRDDRAALLLSTSTALWVSVSVAVVSAWLFYDTYWRWRPQLAAGVHVDDAGRPIYAESAVWSAVCFGALFVAALAARARRRLLARSRAGSPS